MLHQKIIFKTQLTLALLLLNSTLPASAQTPAPEPDAKSVPKSVLMLGMYCNSAKIEMKNHFDANPAALPWVATGCKVAALNSVFSKLDFQGGGYAKSIKDKALTSGENKFLVLTAEKDAKIWLASLGSCGKIYGGDEYETCLQNINSEVYKCYLQVQDQLNVITKNSRFFNRAHEN